MSINQSEVKKQAFFIDESDDDDEYDFEDEADNDGEAEDGGEQDE